MCPTGKNNSTMPVVFKQFLSGDSIYTCESCGTHTADHQELVSKAFQGRHGRAYLFSNVVNVTEGTVEERMLITGLHTVCDIQCSTCGNVLGWKYETAYEQSQKYKEGKYILEKAKVVMVVEEETAHGNGHVRRVLDHHDDDDDEDDDF